MRSFSKKKKLVSLSALAVLVVAGVALAYFTSQGSGTATATVGSSSNVTINGTVTSALYPGTSSPVTFTVNNPSPGEEYVHKIHLTSITPDSGHSSCSTVVTGGNPDFTMPEVVVNQDVPSGNGNPITAQGTITMNETGVSQNACQGATLTLNLTSE